jgi:hypothetical protein
MSILNMSSIKKFILLFIYSTFFISQKLDVKADVKTTEEEVEEDVEYVTKISKFSETYYNLLLQMITIKEECVDKDKIKEETNKIREPVIKNMQYLINSVLYKIKKK